MLYPYLVLFYIFTNFSILKYPTPIFISPHFSSFLYFIIMTTGNLMVDLGGGGGD